MKPNVLITACGAKVALVRAFRRAATARGSRVYAADVSDLAVAQYEADVPIRLPPWGGPEYGEVVMTVCRQNDIGLLVPTADRELEYLLPIAESLRQMGVSVLLPSAKGLAVCRDKSAFVSFCQKHGFPVPMTWALDETPSRFPVYVRPRAGQGGLGVGLVKTPSLLCALRQEMSDLVIQEYIDDPEYSVDLLMDLEGHPLQAVARRRLVVHGGEAQVSQVERQDALTDQVMALGHALGLVGHNVVQAFYSPGKGIRFIEVNPRFGGASNLSIEAGLDSPARLLALAAGDESAREPRPIRYGLTMLRHGEDRFLMPAKIP